MEFKRGSLEFQKRLIWGSKEAHLDFGKHYLLSQDVSETASRRICCCVVTQLLLRRDVSDATSGRNFFRIDGEVMNKDCSWQYMADNP